MNINRGLLVGILWMIGLCGFSQKNAKVIVDAKTKQPIDYVYVSSDDDKSLNLLSNKEGRLILVASDKVRSFSFYKIGYLKKTISTTDLLKGDSIFLFQNVIKLDDITVIAKAIDTVVMDKHYYVNDYLVLPNNDLLLITTRINTKGFELAYFKKDRGLITHRKKFKDEPGEHLFNDCFKNSHLVTVSWSRQIFFNSDSSFDFLPRYMRAKFDSTLALCVLEMDTQVIMKYALPPHLNAEGFVEHSYFLNYMNVSKHKRQLFYSVLYNRQMREMLKYELADWKMILKNAELFGVANPQSGAAMESSKQLFFDKIAKPIYAPAFLKNDTVVVFNFQENVIVLLNRNGALLKETAINEKEFSTLRDYEVICDEGLQKFYLKTKKTDKASLQLINIYNGGLGHEIKLEKIFAKNIQVHNGKIYYLVKEKGWDDTCYLYQQN